MTDEKFKSLIRKVELDLHEVTMNYMEEFKNTRINFEISTDIIETAIQIVLSNFLVAHQDPYAVLDEMVESMKRSFRIFESMMQSEDKPLN